MAFKTTIKKARFKVTGYSPEQMAKLGTAVNESIIKRILQGRDIYDSQAPALSKNYALRKEKKGATGIRNLFFTGRTQRAMNVISAQQNRTILGITDAEAAKRVYINARRSRQYGISPTNRDVLTRTLKDLPGERPVSIV